MTLISSVYLILPLGKEISEKIIVQHPGSKKVDLLELSEQTRRDWFVAKREMNGSGSIQSRPSDCFLSDAFVDFLQKVAVGHVSMFQTVTSFQGIFGTGFKPSRCDTAKVGKSQQSPANQSIRRGPDAAGGKAFRRFLAHFCCCLFFPWDLNFAA